MTPPIAELRTTQQQTAEAERMMVMSSRAATKTPTKKPVKAKAAKVPAKKPTKKPTKKPVKTKTSKPKKKVAPTSGQSADIDIPFEELNDKELRIMTHLNGEGSGACMKVGIKEISKIFLRSKVPAKKRANAKTAAPSAKWASSVEQAISWTRNSLRRPVASKWIVKDSRGVFKISTRARKRLNAE